MADFGGGDAARQVSSSFLQVISSLALLLQLHPGRCLCMSPGRALKLHVKVSCNTLISIILPQACLHFCMLANALSSLAARFVDRRALHAADCPAVYLVFRGS